MANIQPIPIYAEVLSGKFLSGAYYYYLSDLQGRLQSGTSRLGSPVTVSAKTASIGTTAITLPTLAGAFYKVDWYLAVTTPAGTNSSLTLTIGYTDGAVSKTQASAAMTSNATALPSSGTFCFQADQASPITYAFTYASTPAAAMVYKAYLVVSQVV